MYFFRIFGQASIRDRIILKTDKYATVVHVLVDSTGVHHAGTDSISRCCRDELPYNTVESRDYKPQLLVAIGEWFLFQIVFIRGIMVCYSL